MTDFSTITACGECCVGCEKKIKGICPGCIEAEGRVPEWAGSGTCKVYACCREHNAKFCGLCEEFPCNKLPQMISWNPNIVEHLTKLRDEYKKRNVKLRKAKKEDMHTLWEMQVEAFTGLLEKYQDYDMSPAAESYERILQKYDFEGTTYFFIVADGVNVGGIRIIDKKDGSRKRISPLWIMPDCRNKGYAQQAILEAERIYGSDNWSLDTILQEAGNIHLYEKLGYKRTGKIEKIRENMDIIYFEKD